jgi:hypothetical protein
MKSSILLLSILTPSTKPYRSTFRHSRLPIFHSSKKQLENPHCKMYSKCLNHSSEQPLLQRRSRGCGAGQTTRKESLFRRLRSLIDATSHAISGGLTLDQWKPPHIPVVQLIETSGFKWVKSPLVPLQSRPFARYERVSCHHVVRVVGLRPLSNLIEPRVLALKGGTRSEKGGARPASAGKGNHQKIRK